MKVADSAGIAGGLASAAARSAPAFRTITCRPLAAKRTALFKLPDSRSVIPSVLSTMEAENQFSTATTVARTFILTAMADVPRPPPAITAAYGATDQSSNHGGTAV
jgi:hypothetical protein